MPERRTTWSWLVCLTAVGIAGCSAGRGLPTAASPNGDATRPATALSRLASPDAGNCFPLQVGDRWHYVVRIQEIFLPADGSPPETLEADSTTSEFELVCAADANGRRYVVERLAYKSGARVFWRWLRQDREGLYASNDPTLRRPPCDSVAAPDIGSSAPVARQIDAHELDRRIAMTTDPIARAAFGRATPALLAALEPSRVAAATGRMIAAAPAGRGAGPDPDESVVLKYPLHPGERWYTPTQRETLTVERVDVLKVPGRREPAFRIRRSIPPGSANYRSVMWYGRSGYLGSEIDSRYEDAFGGVDSGTVVGKETESLDGMRLVGGDSSPD